VALASLCGLLWSAPVLGQEEQEETESEARARAIVQQSLERIQAAAKLQIRMDTSYDVVQESGEHLEFGDRRSVTLRRPDRLRIESRLRDGHEVHFTYDGETGTLYSPDQKAYASATLGGTVDEAIDTLASKLSVPTPLGELLQSDVTSVMDGFDSPLYVGAEEIDGVACEHVAFRGEGADVQFWVTSDDAHLLRRMVVTYLQEEGDPQYRADFLEWSLTPDTPDTLFQFEPPEGAEKVNMVLLRPAGAEEETP
jgi:hypothetical protein